MQQCDVQGRTLQMLSESHNCKRGASNVILVLGIGDYGYCGKSCLHPLGKLVVGIRIRLGTERTFPGKTLAVCDLHPIHLLDTDQPQVVRSIWAM